MRRLVYNRIKMLFSGLLLLSVFLAFVIPETNASESPSSLASRQNNKQFLLPSSIYSRGPLKLVPTVTKSSSTVVTKIDTTSVVCAKLVNVTGPCLRRRGAWVEEPIVLSFHGDFDDAFDLMYSPVLRVETTAAPESTTFDESRLNNDPSTAVASSVHDSEESQRLHGLSFFLFRNVSRWFISLLSQFVATKVPIPINTIIFQRTITVTQTSTVVNTVFVQRCTPSPFPFSLCREKKSRSNYFR